MSCHQFPKATVALRVFKPWGFKLNHTCHTHTVPLMSLCKYLIFSICISQPNLLASLFSQPPPDTVIQPHRTTLLSGTHRALLCPPNFPYAFVSVRTPRCRPLLPAKHLHVPQGSAQMHAPLCETRLVVLGFLWHFTWLPVRRPGRSPCRSVGEGLRTQT